MRYQLNSDTFLQKVSAGDISDLNCETLEIFEKILPKQTEIQKLREVILSEGFDSIEEAQRVAKFGNVEEFMLKCIGVTNLEKKVAILLRILKFVDQFNDHMMTIENWINVFNSVITNATLKEVVGFTLLVAQVMNGDFPVSFDVADLIKLFEVKSTEDTSKVLYQYILKYAFKFHTRDYSALCDLNANHQLSVFNE